MEILDSCMHMKEYCGTHSPGLEVPLVNMYTALLKSLGLSVKANMVSNKKSIGTDRLALLWTLLKMYQGTTSQVIQSTMKRLDKLQETLKGLKFNIFCV